jgi:hypothetical protein
MSGDESFNAIFFAASCIAGVISIFLLLDANTSRVLGFFVFLWISGTGLECFFIPSSSTPEIEVRPTR